MKKQLTHENLKRFIEDFNLDQDKDGRLILAIDVKSFYNSASCIMQAKFENEEAVRKYGAKAKTYKYGKNDRYHPLKVKSIVMSDGHLVMSTSPLAKKIYGFKNIMRLPDNQIPKEKDFIIWKPHMAQFLFESMKVFNIFKRFVAPLDIHVYSCDEAFLDITQYWRRYAESPEAFCKMLQEIVKDELGYYMSAGLSYNMSMAKMCMDNEAKYNDDAEGHLFARWTPDDVVDKLWEVPLIDVWNIGTNTVRDLNKMGITTMAELALANPKDIQRSLKSRGVAIYKRAWGIDEAVISRKGEYKPKIRGIGRGMTLPRPYFNYNEIELALCELADSVAGILIDNKERSATIHIGIGYEVHSETSNGRMHVGGQMKVTATNLMDEIHHIVTYLLDQKYDHRMRPPVRRLAVRASTLCSASYFQYNLMESPEASDKREAFDKLIIDLQKFPEGRQKVYRVSALNYASNTLKRAGDIGGHAA